MTVFWAIILVALGVVLVLAWRSDRRRQGQVGNVGPRARQRKTRSEEGVSSYTVRGPGPSR